MFLQSRTCLCWRSQCICQSFHQSKPPLLRLTLENLCQALQEYSKPNQSFICGSKQEDILKSVLKNIDDTYSDNHNVRSRNGELLNRNRMVKVRVTMIFSVKCILSIKLLNIRSSVRTSFLPFCLFVLSSVRPSVRLFVVSSVRPFVLSFVHSFVRSFVRSLARSPARPPARPFITSFVLLVCS